MSSQIPPGPQTPAGPQTPPASETPPVTIAVVSFNTRELLDRCLESMKPAADAGLAAVWVVDNASADGSAEMVAERHPWAELVRSDENLGFGAAVNLVADRTGSPWIAASNADLELRPGALTAMLDAASGDPAAGVIAPRLVTPSGATQHSVHPFPGPALALAFNAGLLWMLRPLARAWRIEGRWNPDEPALVGWAHGAFLLCRREAWQASGGFDADQWMYAEDIDLCWRMAEAGWSVRYEPRAYVLHHGSAATSAAFGQERLERHLAAAFEWQKRRRGATAAWSALVLNLLGARLRWAINVPLTIVSSRAQARRESYGVWARAHRRVAGDSGSLTRPPAR